MTRTYVALDLETTGAEVAADLITEVGAVRFTAEGVVDRFQTLLRPRLPIPPRIQELTHITNEMVAEAPPFWELADRIRLFVGDDPIVGQNIAYDLAYLKAGGLEFGGPAFDTHELATVLMTGLRRYGLKALADSMEIEFTQHHRALADAEAAMHVFLRLREAARVIEPELLVQIARMGTRAGWRLAPFFEELAEEHLLLGETVAGALGIQVTKPSYVPALKSKETLTPVGPERSTAVLRTGAAAFERFEQRDQQLRMAYAVGKAFAEGGHLVVEAGTGTGKSLAYLAPAALHAMENGERVIVSTNTIALQEQLLNKDIPLLRQLFAEKGIPAGPDDLRVTQLKGRRNYLCLRRWQNHIRSAISGDDDARLTARLLLWLPRTETGDRGELNLSGKEDQLWSRLSAQDANCLDSNCPFVREGTCFLYRSRRQAEAAHIVIVNHSLLLADIAAGGSAIPPYRHLIIDEAHNLEDEATKQFGFSLGQNELENLLDGISERQGRQSETGLLSDVRVAVRPILDGPLGAGWLQQVRAMEDGLSAARIRIPQFFDAVAAFFAEHSEESGDYEYRLLLTRAKRNQPAWGAVEMAWENLAGALRDLGRRLEGLHAAVAAEPELLLDRETLLTDIVAAQARLADATDRLASVVEKHDDAVIAWITVNRQSGTASISSAPLQVDDILAENLMDRMRSAVFTSATLSAGGTFDYFRQRVGVDHARDLLLDSPFPFDRNALLCIPDDLPEPQDAQFQAAVQQAIVDLVTASNGRALILFTSHSHLKATYNGVKARLWERGILCLAQGVDGGPAKLVSELREAGAEGEKPRAIFGTASFWEGVDVEGEALSLLVIVRLPFPVPTDPIFAARSDLMERPFEDYAVPQAVLKFRQGFGRLIRSTTDRGVVVVLDRRLKTKSYGKVFLQSLPKCTRQDGPVRAVTARVKQWLQPGGPAPAPRNDR